MSYEIHYWNDHGRAEALRLIAVAAGLPYRNVFHDDDWPQFKPSTPFGQLPMLVDKNEDFVLAQSGAIARYLARKGGLIPHDGKQLALAEQYQDGIADIQSEFFSVAYSVAEDRYVPEAIAEFRNTKLPAHLARYEKFAQQNGNTGHLVGTKLTYVDILLFAVLESFVKPEAASGELDQMLSAQYPALKKIVDGVLAIPAIASYLKSPDRPARQY
eukprot:GEZU01013726.1.p1 GENE.GEZU01013726.1~~GEZU01013726.1.p1  ORF type:complete len:215 (-),score=56.30 GEZU01013726.1:34-678(-)